MNKFGTAPAAGGSAVQTIIEFHNALNARDLDGMNALLSDDTVFENTFPAPDGTRYVGKQEVAEFWEDFFQQSSSSIFDIEELFGLYDRWIMLWSYSWTDLEGQSGRVRGVDIYRVDKNRITEKLSYVKG